MYQEPTELLCIGCFDRNNLDPKIQIKHIGTKNLLADILTKGKHHNGTTIFICSTSAMFSSTCCAKNCTRTPCRTHVFLRHFPCVGVQTSRTRMAQGVCSAHVTSLHLTLSIILFHPPSLLFLDGHFETTFPTLTSALSFPNCSDPISRVNCTSARAARSLATWPIPRTPQVMSPNNDPNFDYISDLLKVTRENTGLFGVSTMLEAYVSPGESKDSMHRETVAREREREKKGSVISVAESMSKKSRRNSIVSSAFWKSSEKSPSERSESNRWHADGVRVEDIHRNHNVVGLPREDSKSNERLTVWTSALQWHDHLHVFVQRHCVARNGKQRNMWIQLTDSCELCSHIPSRSLVFPGGLGQKNNGTDHVLTYQMDLGIEWKNTCWQLSVIWYFVPPVSLREENYEARKGERSQYTSMVAMKPSSCFSAQWFLRSSSVSTEQ